MEKAFQEKSIIFWKHSYLKSLEALYAKPSSIFHKDLEPIQRICQALGFPEKQWPSIHVAGTNGKGSVATKIFHAFHLSGYRTGLYLSPHISSFRERISIDGKPISQKEVVEGLQRIEPFLQGLERPLTFFEKTTLLCFEYFAKKNIEIAVIETGLGGRWDATNILSPLLSIITSIDLEHCKILGDNRESIGNEKAGIIKEKVPVVLGPKALLEGICKRAEELQSPLHIVSGNFEFFDQENGQIALLALKELQKNFSLSSEAIQKAILQRPPCRFEVFSPTSFPGYRLKGFPEALIFDGAHNPEALRSLFRAVKFHFPSQPLRVIFGISQDKEVESCVRIVEEASSNIHLVCANHPRALSVEKLSSFFSQEKSKLFTESTPLQTLSSALELAFSRREIIIACGSFFIMEALRRALEEKIVKG